MKVFKFDTDYFDLEQLYDIYEECFFKDEYESAWWGVRP